MSIYLRLVWLSPFHAMDKLPSQCRLHSLSSTSTSAFPQPHHVIALIFHHQGSYMGIFRDAFVAKTISGVQNWSARDDPDRISKSFEIPGMKTDRGSRICRALCTHFLIAYFETTAGQRIFFTRNWTIRFILINRPTKSSDFVRCLIYLAAP